MSDLHNTTCIICCQAAADWQILQHKQHTTKTASERQVKHVDHLCFISDKPPWKLIFFHQPRSSLRISSFRSPSIKIHLLHTNHQTTWSTRSLLHLRIKIHHQTTYTHGLTRQETTTTEVKVSW